MFCLRFAIALMTLITFWFGFWFVVFAVRYPLPEIRDEVPKNFQRTDAFDRQRVLIGRTTAKGPAGNG